jgi:ATP-dependent Clp protease ATP-binding subunit ClpC
LSKCCSVTGFRQAQAIKNETRDPSAPQTSVAFVASVASVTSPSMDIIEKFSSNLKTVLTRALCLAVETNDEMIMPKHLLWALGTQKGCIAAELLKKAGVKTTELKKLVGEKRTPVDVAVLTEGVVLHLSDEAKRVVEKAVLTANIYGHRYIGTEHLLTGLLQIEFPALLSFFSEQKIDLKFLREQIAIVLKNTSKFPEMTESIKLDEATELMAGIQETEQQNEPRAQKLQALTFFSRELTSPEMQKKIDPVIGRESEIERVMEILCRRTKNNPLLVGEPGVGKTAVVEGLAKNIFEGSVPPLLQNKRIFALDLALLVAGTMYRGEFEGRLRQIIDEASKSDDVILFIDELHSIVGAGAASGSMDAANILKPALARGEIHCIGATTHAEFKKHIESDSALERRFQSVNVEEPSVEAAIEILQGIAPHYETFHGVRIAPEAIEHAVKLSTRYLTDRRLPDKAIDLLDEASAAARIRTTELRPLEKRKAIERQIELLSNDKRQAVIEERFLDAVHLKATEDLLKQELEMHTFATTETSSLVINGEDVARVISRMMHIPLSDLLAKDQSSFVDIETRLSSHVFGQPTVVSRVANALKRAKTGVAHPSRPLASFLFLGPSGVGKTELAKAIAQQFFSSSKHLIRLDMSEYSEGFTMSKLIGAPAGYIGYKETANLTDRVKQKPYAVVLFDEIEKAHKDVQNLLLQILEEGELADATGKMVNFRNTIVVLTSNVGLERFESGGIGFSGSETETSVRLTEDIQQELKDRFRPELLNRIDHTCVFDPLSSAVLSEIFDKQLKELVSRMQNQGIELSIEDLVTEHLVKKIDMKSGARSVRQLIQSEIESILAERLLKADKAKKLKITLDKKPSKTGSGSAGQLTIRKTR